MLAIDFIPRRVLETVFDEVILVNVLDSGDSAHLALMKRPELGVTLTKLHCWELTQFSKCVFMDADTMVSAHVSWYLLMILHGGCWIFFFCGLFLLFGWCVVFWVFLCLFFLRRGNRGLLEIWTSNSKNVCVFFI